MPDSKQNSPRARLFFALWPDAQTRHQLALWSTALQRICGGRRMQAVDLHMTLVFIGDVAIDQLESIKRAAQQVQPRRFEMPIDRSGYWPHNKIGWAGVADAPVQLHAVVDDLRKALTLADLRFDTQAFVPHITLIRNALRDAGPIELPPISWSIEDFVLLRSIGAAGPSRYVIEARWRCADALRSSSTAPSPIAPEN